MLICEECGAGASPDPDNAGPGFERREYVRLETFVDRHDEPGEAGDEGVISDPGGAGAERTYRCLSCGSHEVRNR